MDWAQILVIILSLFLAIFLLLGIILVYLLIRVTKQIKDVTESAGRTVRGFEKMVEGVTKIASPALVGKIVFEQMSKLRDRGKEKK